ncbi:MAG: GH92 family glycosyl hydrolase [Tannerellaceae bacterium]|jgi:predicted alpha-1,2-mannosidase|nr:GH92 family glycosyl hydrolase [Tannerellaceae bacterium]
MNRSFVNFFAAIALLASCVQQKEVADGDIAAYVNPFVGVDLAGHTYPGAITPFGMVQVSPDTQIDGWEGCSGYHFKDSHVYGFSHTHLNGTGCADYNDVLLMPFVGNTSVINSEYRAEFSHDNETAAPGYYSVKLNNSGILVELTAARRLGVQKYSFPENGEAKGVLIDLKHRDKVIESYIKYDAENGTITGVRNSSMWNEKQLLSYAIVFSQPIASIDFYKDDKLMTDMEFNRMPVVSGTNIKAVVWFNPGAGDVVVKTAISSNTQAEDAALKNLRQYDGYGFDFVRFKDEAREEWNRELGRITVETNDVEKKKVFYTAMYHSFTSPYLFTDADGTYLGMDYKLHEVEAGHEVYTVFSLWDTYRALHPLLNIIDRRRTEDFIYTFVKQYEQGGALPVWELSAWETNCMIGYHSIPVIYDAFVKGMADYDHARMLEAMVHSAKTAWRGLPEFSRYGFIPADMEPESVSKTVEYAYDDWCIAQFAKAIGNDSIYKEFNDRCLYYRNILDTHGFMHAKINGSFVEPFDPREVNSTLTEANSWQYSTYVPHDADAFIELLGGSKVAEQHFDSLFYSDSEMTGRQQADISGLIGQYAHGNEPSHHAAYWYNFIGKQWKSSEILRKIMREFYTSKPDGLCGNDDCGQMSAWYVFNAMGFYPFCPGTNQYLLGSPIFDRITMKLENGKQFVIVCKNQSDKNIYIQSVELNGRTHTKSYISYDDLKDGGEIIFTMGSKPNLQFGANEDDRPHARVESTITTVPILSASSKTFPNKMSLSMTAFQPANKDADCNVQFPAQTDEIYYTLDGSQPTRQSLKYTEPLEFTKDTKVKAVSYNERTGYSKVVEADYRQYNKDKDILKQTIANPAYYCGEDALLDGMRGTLMWNLGNWNGYEGKDVEVTIDLREKKSFNEAGAGFLQDVGPWIIFPTAVTFEISDDNETYTTYGVAKSPNTPALNMPAQMYDFVVKKPATARYLKITAKSFGKMPDWSAGAGYASHIFMDEIFVR